MRQEKYDHERTDISLEDMTYITLKITTHQKIIKSESMFPNIFSSCAYPVTFFCHKRTPKLMLHISSSMPNAKFHSFVAITLFYTPCSVLKYRLLPLTFVRHQESLDEVAMWLIPLRCLALLPNVKCPDHY